MDSVVYLVGSKLSRLIKEKCFKEEIYMNRNIDLVKYNRIKRIFDIVFSIALLIFTSPILLVSFIIVYLQDFKSPFFSHKRVGVNNEEFSLYKVRTMVYDAEEYGVKWTSYNDSRITWFGKFIRKYRIDELPQLFNVIKGDMSIIGPRPELEFLYREFEKSIFNYRDRLKVKPGITGWAQVNGGYNLTPKEKLDLDLYYINNMGYSLDIKIIFRTIKVIFTGYGSR